MTLELIDKLGESFGQISTFVHFSLIVFIELQFVNLVLKLSKVRVFLYEGEDSSESIAELDETNSINIWNRVLRIFLHNLGQNSCDLIFIPLHAGTLIDKKDEVTISETEWLDEFFKLQVNDIVFGKKKSELIGTFLSYTWVVDLTSVDTSYEAAFRLGDFALTYTDKSPM